MIRHNTSDYSLVDGIARRSTYVLDGDGKALANQEISVLRDGDQFDSKKVLDFLTKNETKPWKAEELLKSALTDAQKHERSLLVTFGAPW